MSGFQKPAFSDIYKIFSSVLINTWKYYYIYIYIPVKPLCLLEMRHNPLMNFMLAVPHRLLKGSTKVSLAYSSSKGWGFYYYTVTCVDETWELKYWNTPWLAEVHIVKEQVRGQRCWDSDCTIVNAAWFSYGPDDARPSRFVPSNQERREYANGHKRNEFHSWNGGDQQEVDWKHSTISFISSYFWHYKVL